MSRPRGSGCRESSAGGPVPRDRRACRASARPPHTRSPGVRGRADSPARSPRSTTAPQRTCAPLCRFSTRLSGSASRAATTEAMPCRSPCSTTNPVCPWTSVSRTPPVSMPTTGTSHACASRKDSGKVSISSESEYHHVCRGVRRRHVDDRPRDAKPVGDGTRLGEGRVLREQRAPTRHDAPRVHPRGVQLLDQQQEPVVALLRRGGRPRA